MKHLPLRLALLLLPLLFSTNVFSQLKEGFSKLKKGDYDTALDIFKAAYQDPSEQIAAKWGQAKVLATPEFQEHNYNESYLLADSVSQLLRKLRKSEKEELAKKYDIEPAAITELKNGLAELSWNEVAQERTLRSVDSFLKVFKKPNKFTAKAKKLQNTLRRDAVKNWTSYKDMAYLYADSLHRAWLKDSLPSELTRIENALLPAFWASSRKVSEIGVFFDDLSQHPLSKHATAPSFRAAAESGKLKNLLAFELKYPRSPFSKYARAEIKRINGERPPSQSELTQLTSDERQLLDDILGGSVDCYSEFTGADTSAWHRYIESHAVSSTCGKRNLENMLSFYLNNRRWQEASNLLKQFGPLFPEEKARYDELTTLLDASETGDLPQSAGKNINTAKGSEYTPTITPDGKFLYFCGQSRSDNVGGEDIYYSEWVEGKWQPAKLVREISIKESNEAPLSFTADGNQMIYFKNGRPYVSTRTETTWSAGVPMALDLSDFYWVGKVQIAPNNRFAIFEAKNYDQPDIYIAFKNDDDTWQTPSKLDSTINTPAAERFPYLHPDMRHLYFSSAGLNGFGDLDVFVSTRLDDTWLKWSKPVNLGKMINTPDSDWGYSVSPDGVTAWFSRGDKDGQNQDIFSVKLPERARAERPRQVEAFVTDSESKPLGGAEIIAYHAETGEKIGSYRTGASSGKSFFSIENDKRVIFAAKKEGYFPKSIEVDFRKLPRDSIAKVYITLPKMKMEGDTVTLLSDVFFETNKWDINPKMRAELKILGDFLRSNSFKIELSGHTDKIGNPDENKKLSERRAEAVQQLLIDVGVPAERISAKGYGETQPICNDDSPGCHAKNRRVEIRWKK